MIPNIVHPNVAVRTFSSIQNNSLAFLMSSSDRVPDMYRNQASGALFLRTDGDGETADDGKGAVEISDDFLQEILRGDYPIVMGHAESWLSDVGRMIIKELRKKNMIGAVVFDEVHKSLKWTMRPRMQDIGWFKNISRSK